MNADRSPHDLTLKAIADLITTGLIRQYVD